MCFPRSIGIGLQTGNHWARGFLSSSFGPRPKPSGWPAPAAPESHLGCCFLQLEPISSPLAWLQVGRWTPEVLLPRHTLTLRLVPHPRPFQGHPRNKKANPTLCLVFMSAEPSIMLKQHRQQENRGFGQVL